MNLKTAFRYQNLISTLLTSMNDKFDAGNYKTTTVINKKSELNSIALNAIYEDEQKVTRGNVVKRYNSFYDSSTSKKVYDFKVTEAVYLYLITLKAQLTDAIAKAKTKIKINIPDSEFVLGYDAAISYSKGNRQYANILTGTSKDLIESETETSSSQKIIVSAELPPTDGIYPVITKITLDEGIEDTITASIEEAKIRSEYLSNEIEAAALSTVVKFDTDLKLTETFDGLYNKFAADLKK